MNKVNYEMWLVYTNEEGMVLVTDDYNEAVTTYESEKERTKDWCNKNLEFCGEERVILAKVEKQLFYREMNKEELRTLQNNTEEQLDLDVEYGLLEEVEYIK
ncbi:hypothetical protein ACFO6R_06030 [Eubacterium multiforme]|uniref:Glycine cleavage system aminomethyltransferase T n=1 Tax=Eubacterium multiforme TaxID=83339 RepID=A0ABT9US54_9FIRM|nr:hypothetical protein [Eubacterium multiforme]MDQ0149143.1 glycine cleavage system aminomethyltransferase T [Eubacterium multiforme]